MSSAFQSFRNRSFIPSMPTTTKGSLPVSQTDTYTESSGLHRRLSSLSLKIQADPSSGWGTAVRRSKSVSSMGEYAGISIRKWWDWGWGWILSRKPIFAKDLEMNEQETAVLGCSNQGSWRHVFYKVRSELKRLVRSDRDVGLPQTFRYDSSAYSRNFDHERSATPTLTPHASSS
ncbi:Protein downstream neighbor of son like [Actinidia chinensis var. chinensis]|uniref:Protein downstream neighbor of son like n=1 Tax=Actinidia chinensis var. chinensis TaxID=1590841 RepID=A0A2R6RNE3_ACTCC|nr:Protein downstream neighbor of son like [Actinidia chinensis var. chinensis]